MNDETLAGLAARCGFTAWAPLDVSTIELKPEVRRWCADDVCGQYGRRWSCPPGCGALDECARRLARYERGILVQTAGEVAGSSDFEAVAEIEAGHKARFGRMRDALRAAGVDVLALGSGYCNRCDRCAFPDAPCRFPEEMVSSMEAYGMLVLEVCRANGLRYDYGPDRMAFTSCFLVK